MLDSAGTELSWLTGLPWSDNYRVLAEKWKSLPVYQNKAKLRALVEAVAKAQVTVVISGTGSGKTTIIPKVVLRHVMEASQRSGVDGVQQMAKRVAVTNPKSSITEGNARYAADTLDVPLGKEVGYAFRDAPEDSKSDATRLLFATDGYLLAQSRKNPTFEEFSAVIVDEAHERTVPIDTLLFMLRRATALRPDFRVIVMSATIDPALFADYFAETALATPGPPISVRVLSVSGVPYHPVRSVFLSEEDQKRLDKEGGDYMEAGMRALGDALRRTGPGEDVLFFVPTARETDRGCQTVSEACAQGRLPAACARLQCSTLYSKLSKEKQEVAKSVALQSGGFDRKIIFATNIAESSLTLPSLTTVIDSGLELENVYEPGANAYRLNKVMSSQAQIQQRKGRVGRVQPGTCYHLYTPERMMAQPFYPAPRILTADITDQFLSMMREKNSSFEGACRDLSQFITPPTPVQIASTASVLTFYGMITITDLKNGGRLHFNDVDFASMARSADLGRNSFTGRITRLGTLMLDVMRKTKLGFWNALLVLSGLVYGHLVDMVTLATLLEETNADADMLFRSPKDVVLPSSKGGPAASSAVMQRIYAAAKLSATSEHASFLSLYREARKRTNGSKDSPFLHAPLVNEPLIKKVDTRVSSTISTMRNFEVRSMRSILDETPLLTVPDNGKFSVFEKCIISARLHNAAAMVMGGSAYGVFETLLNLTKVLATPDASLLSKSGRDALAKASASIPRPAKDREQKDREKHAQDPHSQNVSRDTRTPSLPAPSASHHITHDLTHEPEPTPLTQQPTDARPRKAKRGGSQARFETHPSGGPNVTIAPQNPPKAHSAAQSDHKLPLSSAPPTQLQNPPPNAPNAPNAPKDAFAVSVDEHPSRGTRHHHQQMPAPRSFCLYESVFTSKTGSVLKGATFLDAGHVTNLMI